MQEFDDVLSDYISTRTLYSRVPGKNSTPSLVALRESIPELLRLCIKSSGLNTKDFKVRGSPGDNNFSFAKVPWVAIFNRQITRSARDGYYIVILFAEDMSCFWLTLNQAYTAFGSRYFGPGLARAKLADCARAAVDRLGSPPVEFVVGPIDLHTKGELGLGYEAGSIFAKKYIVGNTPSFLDLEADVHFLLESYAKLFASYPISLIDLDIGVGGDLFTDAVIEASKKATPQPGTVGKQPPPPFTFKAANGGYARSVQVAGRALAMSGAKCALSPDNPPHSHFTSRRTGKQYVELHHLVPFSQQANFSVSLDVEENIIALCPHCHRLLHNGIDRERTTPLKTLLGLRKDDLVQRGIIVDFDNLRKMYKMLTPDD